MRRIISGKERFYILFTFLIIFLVIQINCSQQSEKLDKVTVMMSSVSLGDPHIVVDSPDRLSIIFSVYDALVKLDEDGKYQPSLAESWDVSEDARTWTFYLRSGVKFHNGDLLFAEDVVATLKRVLDPAIGGAFGTQGVYISYLGDADISVVEDLKVRIVTSEPMADLPDLLSAMPVSPRSELDKLPGEYVGSGPYKIAETSPTRTILKANENYWGNTPKYKEIHWLAESNSGKRVDALLNGDAEIVSGIGLPGRDRIIKDGGAEVYEINNTLCIIFMCNSQKGPCMDRHVRQALNYALDTDKIIEKIKDGAAKPLNGFLTPLHFGHNPETPVYPYDPDKARKLLAEAGYKEGLKLVFDFPSVMPDEAPDLVQMMKEYFEQVGITLEVVEHKDRAAYSETVRAKNINDACCFDSSPRSTYRVLREKIQSTRRGPWWQGYKNLEVNALIKQAEATINNTERQKIYRRIYTIIRDDAPWIFLYNPTRYTGVSSSMKDWKPGTDGILVFN